VNQTRAPDDGSYTMFSYTAEAERLAAEVWQPAAAAAEEEEEEEEEDKSFFLYYAQQEIHVPLERPPADQPQHLAHCAAVSSFPERQTLCMMMSALDAEVGRFVADLKARGLWENTLLWVVTDNGGMTHFRGDFSFPASGSSNWPLRGGKTTLFEGGVRGVSFVGGGFLPAAARGTESHELMHAADIPATLAALGGAPPSADLDGVDMWPTLTAGATGARTEVPVNINPRCLACRAAANATVDYSALIQRSADGAHDWKLVSGFIGLYDGYWTNEDRGYAHLAPPANDTDVPATAWRLYDLAADETESDDVAAANPRIVEAMIARIAYLGDKKNGYTAPQLNIPPIAPAEKDKAMPSAANNYTWAPWE
jgi:arylsulfatase B